MRSQSRISTLLPRGASALWLVFLALCLAFVPLSPRAIAQTDPAAPAPALSSNRFLFVIDSSALMKRQKDDIGAVIDEILQSSANGQLHPGDTIGVWTFNQQLNTGVMPLQTWKAGASEQINFRMREFLKSLKFEKTSRLDLAVAAADHVVKLSDLITVVIISDGKSPIEGTPFDKEINRLYAQSVAEMQKKPRAVVTVLQGKSGRFTSQFTVSARPWPIDVPALPISLKTVAEQRPVPAPVAKPAAPVIGPSMELSGPQTRPARPITIVGPAGNPTPAPVSAPTPAPAPVVPQPESIAVAAPVAPAVTPPPAPAPAPVSVTPVDRAAFNNPSPPPLPAAFVGNAMPEPAPAPAPVVVHEVAPVAAAPVVQATPAPVAAVSPEPSSAAAVAVAKPASPAPSTKALPTPTGGFFKSLVSVGQNWMLTGAAILLVLSAVLLLIILRRYHNQQRVSLISQTINQTRN